MTGRWPHVVVVGLLLGHLGLLSVRSSDGPLERTLLGAVAPIAHGVSEGTESVSSLFGSLRTASMLRAENRTLKVQVDAMRREMVRLQGIEEEYKRLARLASYQRPGSDAFVADVVYADPGSWLRTLVVHSASGLPRHNQAVITDRGLVGRVAVASGRYAKVLLITDRAASVSAMISRTRRQGMIQGDGADRLLLTNVPIQSDVRVGDEVVSAGLDGVFPRGVPVGIVRSVEPTPGLFHRIVVEPTVDFGLLEKVYVLRSAPLPDGVREELVEPTEAGSDRP